jgi:hypothetical protein
VAESKEYDEYELSNADWGKIHKLAWDDADADMITIAGETKPVKFGTALERDPTAAIRYFVERKLGLRVTTLKIVKLRPPPTDVDPEFWEDVNPFPPSCC